MKQCDGLEKYMLGEIGRRIAKAEKKQILLFRKAEALISDIDVE